MKVDKIKVDLSDITIVLPESKIIVEKDEYKQLKQEANIGRYLTMNDVLEMLSVSRPWLLENVLYNPLFRSKIDIDKNAEGFVKYPTNQGGRYFFLASRTREFFEKNFVEIFK